MDRQQGSIDPDHAIGSGCLGIIVWWVAAWITHIVICINASSWGLLIGGAIMFPIAVVHGTGYWFGFFH